LADDPNVIVEEVPEDCRIASDYDIGPLGLLNGVLNALGLTRAAAVWTDGDKPKLAGFVPYEMPEDTNEQPAE